MYHKTTVLSLSLLALLLVGAGCAANVSSEIDADIRDESPTQGQIAPGEPMGGDNNEEVDELEVDAETEVDADVSAAGTYRTYDEALLSRASSGDVVLFFHAAWCPTCRALNGDIEENSNQIPADVTILKTDYDTNIALRQKYGVTTQHTMVQVDSEGNLVQKWSGGNTLESIVNKL